MEVGNAFVNAAVPDITYPGWVTSPVSGAALTPGDNPVELIKTELTHGSKQRLGADEADGRRNLPEVIGAPGIRGRLDGNPDPDVWRPGQGLAESREAQRDIDFRD
jgi:hypothetical protein